MFTMPACRAEPPHDAPWWWLRANWVYAAITSGALPDHDGTDGNSPVPVALGLLGRLSFDDGRLVVADPYLMGEDAVPVVQELVALPYDVVAATATVGPDHPRIAAALLVRGDDPVVSWQMAHWPDQDLASLGPQEFFGYGVDAGTGCFASPAGAEAAGRVLMADAGMLADPVSAALFSGSPGAGAAVVAPAAGAVPLAVCPSGWGDGSYPTWLGLNDRDEVAVAMTDFLLT